jgi:hypothetical protein
LTVTARDITVTADNKTRKYGNANPALTWTVGGDGLYTGDSLTGSLTTTATASSNIGTYAIAQGTLAASSNYAIAYTSGNLTITKRDITVTAANASRKYGNANPALTWTVGADGLYTGDSLTGSLTTTATASSNIGTYAIAQGTLAASSNYAIAYTSGNLTITKRDITVVAENKTRKYGVANPTFTYKIGGDGLFGSDALITPPSLSTTADLVSKVGTYAITASGAVATSNYNVTVYIPGTLTIDPALQSMQLAPAVSEALRNLFVSKPWFRTEAIVTPDLGVAPAVIEGLDDDEAVKIN